MLHVRGPVVSVGDLFLPLLQVACRLLFIMLHCCECELSFNALTPRAGSGVVRIDPLRFLAGCHKRRLNQT